MQEALSDIRALGADLYAVCPQRPEFLRQMRSKHGLEFEILRDEGNKVAAEFGLRYQMPDYIRDLYTSFGADLPRVNGEDSWTLPTPARYVIDGEGKIFEADFAADYRFRPEPSKTIEDLKRLNGKK